jgi:hypothetical protein
MKTTASGECAHAEGRNTVASGSCSHAEGRDTVASGYASHASGLGTIASGIRQMAIGQYNKENQNAWFIIGNGNQDKDTKEITRSNVFEVLKDGNTIVAANIYASGIISDDSKLITVGEAKAMIQAYINDAILGGAW